MANHTHFTCEHELKFCKECDVPFCGKCGKEWGKDKPVNPITPSFPAMPPYLTNPIIDNLQVPRAVPLSNELIRTVNIEKGEKPS